MLPRFLIPLILTLCSFLSLEGRNYIFFLHSRFVEMEGLRGAHPDYGANEYQKKPDYYRQHGFEVVSELRQRGTDARDYAPKAIKQVNKLLGESVRDHRSWRLAIHSFKQPLSTQCIFPNYTATTILKK